MPVPERFAVGQVWISTAHRALTIKQVAPDGWTATFVDADGAEHTYALDLVKAEWKYAYSVQPSGERHVVPTEFRKDGWPMCPICGEDELYTLAEAEDPLRSVLTKQAAIDSICGCYRCGPLTIVQRWRVGQVWRCARNGRSWRILSVDHGTITARALCLETSEEDTLHLALVMPDNGWTLTQESLQ